MPWSSKPAPVSTGHRTSQRSLGLGSATRARRARRPKSTLGYRRETFQADHARGLIEEHAASLDRSGSTWRELLCNQWLGQKQRAFAAIVTDFGGSAGRTRVVTSMVEAAVGEAPARAAEAIELLDGDATALAELAVALVAWTKVATPVTAIGKMAPPFVALETRGVDLSALRNAIEERAAALTSGADVAALVGSVEAIENAGCQAVTDSANALARRALALGVTDGPAAQWIALHSDDDALATKVVADAVRSPSVPVPAAIAAADGTRRQLGRTAEVAFALVERAGASGTTQPDAESLLKQAKLWRPQPGTAKREYEDALSGIARAMPDLDDLVNDLKLVGKRRKQ